MSNKLTVALERHLERWASKADASRPASRAMYEDYMAGAYMLWESLHGYSHPQAKRLRALARVE
jgi:hypothetical protein